MTLRPWLHGLAAAAIGGFSTAITLGIANPVSFNLTTGFRPLLESALVAAALSAAGYLKQSPLPPDAPKA